MNKKIFLSFILASLLLVGCANSNVNENFVNKEVENEIETFSYEPYELFLGNEMQASISNVFDESLSQFYGSYYLRDLKDELENFEEQSYSIAYCYVDLNNDHRDELLLRFLNNDLLMPNKTFVITQKDEGLKICNYIEDGYRSSIQVNTDGSFYYQGSSSAFRYLQMKYIFDQDLNINSNQRLDTIYGMYLADYAFDLGQPLNADPYYAFELDSELTSYVYTQEQYSSLYVTNYSNDPYVKEREEQLVEELKNRGANVISEDEYNKLVADFYTEAELVEWKFVEPNNGTIYLSSDIDENYKEYEQCVLTNDIHASDFIVTTHKELNNFDIVTLELTNINNQGIASYKATSVYHKDLLSTDTPFFLSGILGETIPTLAISYEDSQGQKVYYSISISGKDGSTLFTRLENVYE